MSQHWRYGLLSLLVVALLAMAPRAGDNFKEDEEKPLDPATEARERAFDDLETAHQLINYARTHKMPEAILTAVDILHRTPTGELDSEIEGGEPGKVDSEQQRWQNLLDEARKMRPDDKNLAALLDQMSEKIKEKSRPIVIELGRPPAFIRTFTGSTSFSRTFAPPNGRLRVHAVPGQGLFKDYRINVRVRRGSQTVRNQTFTLTFANSSRTIYFGVPTAANHNIRVSNLSGGPLTLGFNMIQ